MNILEEYQKQRSDFIKACLAKTLLYVTLFLISFEALTTLSEDKSQGRIVRINDLSAITGQNPDFGDNLYSTYLLIHMPESAMKRSFDPDTVSSARAEMDKLATEIIEEADRVFKTKITFLNQVTIDLRTAIFALPFIIIFVETYFAIQRSKIKWLELKVVAEALEPFESEQQKILFLSQPFRFGDTIMIAINFAFFCMIAVAIWTPLASKESGAIGTMILTYYFYFAYLGLAFWVKYHAMLFGERDKSLHKLVYERIIAAGHWLVRKVKPVQSISISGVTFFTTLFLATFTVGCEDNIGSIPGYQAFNLVEDMRWTGDFLGNGFGRNLYVATTGALLISLVVFFVPPLYRRIISSRWTLSCACVTMAIPMFYFSTLPGFMPLAYVSGYIPAVIFFLSMWYLVNTFADRRPANRKQNFIFLFLLMMGAIVLNFVQIFIFTDFPTLTVSLFVNSTLSLMMLDVAALFLFFAYFKAYLSLKSD
jgi:hypothetical protein